ncbi:hypothetical protein [Ketobacter sp.]|uniref:hypothetical protein n=1 Tax=Ketobacter sp. TaxID=2083498 RepID=UPI000F1A935E|nr:hypothetical protein [Ketobacter sp.]RLT92986.1 MAG: hypothetical protein D9N14_19200 [Ketobacter sp.]
MNPQSPYIRYRASSELFELVQTYIDGVEGPEPQPDVDVLVRAMDLFVKESVATFVLQPAAHVGLKPAFLKMIHSLSKLTEKSAMMLVNKVARKMSLQDHRNAAAYMQAVRLTYEEDGQMVGDILFPIRSEFAEMGWETRVKMLGGQAKDPAVLAEGIQFLHEVIDVANLWVFEKPMEILQLGPVMRKLAVSTVGTVKKATHSLINTLVPKISEQQTVASAEYFSGIVGPGPFAREYGQIPDGFLAAR